MLESCVIWDSFRAAAEGQVGWPGVTGSSLDPVFIPRMALSCLVSKSTKCLYFGSWIELRCLAFLAWWSWVRSWIPTHYSLLQSVPLRFEVNEAPVTFSVLTGSVEGTYLICSWICFDLSWLELRHLWEAALLLDIIPLESPVLRTGLSIGAGSL